jgi:hypothetical protein
MICHSSILSGLPSPKGHRRGPSPEVRFDGGLTLTRITKCLSTSHLCLDGVQLLMIILSLTCFVGWVKSNGAHCALGSPPRHVTVACVKDPWNHFLIYCAGKARSSGVSVSLTRGGEWRWWGSCTCLFVSICHFS